MTLITKFIFFSEGTVTSLQSDWIFVQSVFLISADYFTLIKL